MDLSAGPCLFRRFLPKKIFGPQICAINKPLQQIERRLLQAILNARNGRVGRADDVGKLPQRQTVDLAISLNGM